MKADVARTNSIVGYDIKSKHMATMTPFFASKNFELRVSLPDSPPKEKVGGARADPLLKSRVASSAM